MSELNLSGHEASEEPQEENLEPTPDCYNLTWGGKPDGHRANVYHRLLGIPTTGCLELNQVIERLRSFLKGARLHLADIQWTYLMQECTVQAAYACKTSGESREALLPKEMDDWKSYLKRLEIEPLVKGLRFCAEVLEHVIDVETWLPELVQAGMEYTEDPGRYVFGDRLVGYSPEDFKSVIHQIPIRELMLMIRAWENKNYPEEQDAAGTAAGSGSAGA